MQNHHSHGNVKKYVESERVSIIDRICITLQASKGIQHIIHSEMCNNLLMEFKNGINIRNINDIRVVITDYALHSMLTDDGLDASLGSLKWMAPELIENHNTNTTLKTDIYAFGITILTFVLFIITLLLFYFYIFRLCLPPGGYSLFFMLRVIMCRKSICFF